MTTDDSPVPGGEICDILIRDGYVLTLDPLRTVYASGAVAISGHTIVGIGPDRDIAARFRPKRVIDAHGGPVHPGMIDAHVHATNHLCRTIFPDDPRINAFNLFAGWYNVITDEDELANGMIACVEMVRNGFTALMDPGTVFEPDTLAQAAEAVGVRVQISDPFVWDTMEGGNSLAGQINRAPPDPARARRMLGGQVNRKRDPDGTVHAHVALYGSGSSTRELEIEAKRLADAHGVTFNQHQNFTPQQVALDDARFGDGHVLAHFERIGLLGRNCSFTHMNVLRDDEVEAVVRSGMSVVWQPGNYQYYGIAQNQRSRMAELVGRGVNVTVCVDVPKIWTFGDMSRIAYLVARQGGDYLSCETLMEMQTIGAARALGLDHIIGSLEVGKRADIVVRSNNSSEAQPGRNVVVSLMLLTLSRAVDTVLCNGQVIYRNRTLTRLDESAIYRQAEASMQAMLRRLDIRPATTWPVHP